MQEYFNNFCNAKHFSAPIIFHPERILMQDYTAIPAMVDLAALQDKMQEKFELSVPVDIVIDHSLMADYTASKQAVEKNLEIEFSRNKERYTFLKWVQESFPKINVIPPGNGICHQINLESLSQVVCVKRVEEKSLCYFDTLIGTDSHTTMVNGLSVLGWGVGGLAMAFG